MIIVTGGAGLIGSATVHRLNELGEDNILVVDQLGTSEKWRNLCGLQFRDYMEKSEFERYLDNPTLFPDTVKGIVHLGACSSTTETDASFLMENNYQFSKRVAQFSQALDARLVYASSAATYGDGELGYDDQGEFRNFLPLNGYALSKQMFDTWAHHNGLLKRIAGIKYFNVFGPNEYHKGSMVSMVLRGFEQIRDTGELRLFKSDRPDYSDGGQMRDFLYVKDAVKMTLFLLNNPQANGLYNVGSGEANTWNRLGKAIFAAMGKEEKIVYIDMPDHLKGKYQYYTKAETAKVRAAGYDEPITLLEEAVADYVKNYLTPGKRLGEVATSALNQ